MKFFKYIKAFFRPKYDELEVALMGATLIMWCFVDVQFGLNLWEFCKEVSASSWINFIAVIMVGFYVVFPLFSVFDSKAWHPSSKNLMVIFAILANAFVAIMFYTQVFVGMEESSILIIFPLMNLYTVWMSLLFLGRNMRGQDILSDKQATRKEFYVSVFMLLVLLLLLKNFTEYHWAIILSIAFVYCSFVNKYIGKFV